MASTINLNENSKSNSESISQFENRKLEHINIALTQQSQALGQGGFDSIHMIHEAIPSIDFSEVSIKTECLNQVRPTPFFLSGMTAGHKDARKWNDALASACHERGWAMGIGSQRHNLEGALKRDSNGIAGLRADRDQWSDFRRNFPKVQLFANIGVTQITSAGVNEIAELAEKVHADAIAIHLNSLQEVLQVEGTPNFRGAYESIEELVELLPIPVILKETGCGFSNSTLQRLRKIHGLAALDVSGKGGTHWGRIEGIRASGDTVQSKAWKTFANWGEPTVDSLSSAIEVFKGLQTQIWASGGIRTGLDAAKSIAMGAQNVGYAQPALEAFENDGYKGLINWMGQQEFELKVAMFCSGCESISSLRGNEKVWKRK
jgi:isopentenyl-diphosphate Delta-isomerase